MRLRATTDETLFDAGQPRRRTGRVFRHCLRRRGDRRRGKMSVVFNRGGKAALIYTTGPNQRIGRKGPGTERPRKARRVGRGLLVRKAGKRQRIVFGVKRGRVRYVAVATRSVATNRKKLRRHLRLARGR